MARAKKDPITIEQPAVDEAAIRRDLVTRDELTARRTAALARVSEEFDVQLPTFSVELYCDRINFLSGQVADTLLQQGVWLIAMKEALPHGEWGVELTKRTGISVRGAQVIMQATRRFATDAGKKFLANAQHAAHLTKTRLLELAVNMDDAELQALANDEEVAGHSREEYLKMSRSELLAAIRRKDSDLEEGAQQLEAAEKKLKAKKSREKKEDPAEAAIRTFEHAAVECAGDAAKLLRTDLADAFKKLNDTEAAADGWPVDATQRINAAYVDALRKVAQALGSAADALGLDASDLFTPEQTMPADFN